MSHDDKSHESSTPRTWRKKDEQGDDLIAVWKKRPAHSDERLAAEIIDQIEHELAEAKELCALTEQRLIDATLRPSLVAPMPFFPEVVTVAACAQIVEQQIKDDENHGRLQARSILTRAATAIRAFGERATGAPLPPSPLAASEPERPDTAELVLRLQTAIYGSENNQVLIDREEIQKAIDALATPLSSPETPIDHAWRAEQLQKRNGELNTLWDEAKKEANTERIAKEDALKRLAALSHRGTPKEAFTVEVTEPSSPLSAEDQFTMAHNVLNRIDMLLAEASFAQDSSIRHHLKIAKSMFRQAEKDANETIQRR